MAAMQQAPWVVVISSLQQRWVSWVFAVHGVTVTFVKLLPLKVPVTVP